MEDKDFLIVDLNGLDGALRALTAASDLIHICGEKTSCDLLVAESGQEIAEMSDLPRFVFTGPESEGGEETESKESGVGKFLGFAKRAINAVKLGPEALIVAKRIKQNKYDSAYALGSGGPGALIAKASGCEDIIGFAPSVESVVGAHALYNRAFPFPDKCPFLRVRKLIARSFEKIDPPSSPPLFGFRFDNARPDFLPQGHYVVAAGDLAARISPRWPKNAKRRSCVAPTIPKPPPRSIRIPTASRFRTKYRRSNSRGFAATPKSSSATASCRLSPPRSESPSCI